MMVNIQMNGEQLEVVSSFEYLGAFISAEPEGSSYGGRRRRPRKMWLDDIKGLIRLSAVDPHDSTLDINH